MEKKTIYSGMPFICGGVGVLLYALVFGIGSVPSYPIAAIVGVAAYFLGKRVFPDQVIEVEAAPKSGNAEVDALIMEARDQLLRISEANAAIADPQLSAQIDDISLTCKEILQRLEEQPNRMNELRTFLRYYLPTTEKLLAARAKLESDAASGHNGEVISRIHEAVNQVQSAFHKQLEALNAYRFLDLESEMDVLTSMLKSDGLTGEAEDIPDVTEGLQQEAEEKVEDPFSGLFAKGDKG